MRQYVLLMIGSLFLSSCEVAPGAYYYGDNDYYHRTRRNAIVTPGIDYVWPYHNAYYNHGYHLGHYKRHHDHKRVIVRY